LTDLFLVFLAAAWLVIFWPAARRAKRRTPLFSAEGWRRRMSLIAPGKGAGRWVLAPRSSSDSDRSLRRWHRKVQRRRRRILVALLAAVPLTLVAAVFLGGAAWSVHVTTYAVLAVYVAALVEARMRREESAGNVHPLTRRRRPMYEWTAEGHFERREA
jgi:cell division protein FtsB